MSPIPGKEKHLTDYQTIDNDDVMEIGQTARDSAIQTVLTFLMGRPGTYGPRRGLFRFDEMVPIAADPAAMSVKIIAGLGLLNSGEDNAGIWHLVESNEDTVPIAPAHATLDRYDIISLVPKRVGTDSVQKEVMDGDGNVSTVSDWNYKLHDYDVEVVQGDPGGAAPGVTRLTAHTLRPAGCVPIAVVHVRAATTQILDSDIEDVRTMFDLFMAAPYTQPAGVLDKLKDMIPSIGMSHPPIAVTADGITNMPINTIFLDQSAGSPGVLKYKKFDGTVVTFTVT